ncbi:MAG: hypothetical protein RL291_671 [Pseudomonadota bacterium]|jgi:catechol 2,3-dioxygenase-like lactoylglutathione lyase family enzyme
MSLVYVTIGSNDFKKSRAFYDAVMPLVGGKAGEEYEGMTFSYNLPNGTVVWIVHPHNKKPATFGNGVTFGFGCKSADAVKKAHAAALAHGGSDEGAPGPRPDYGPNFFGAYVRDPDGNKMSFVFNGA